LLDGRLLCPSCRSAIESDRWYFESGEWSYGPKYPERPQKPEFPSPPKQPGITDRIREAITGTPVRREDYNSLLRNYDRRLENYEVQRQEYEEHVKECQRKSALGVKRYREITKYWPKDQPPDWDWRRAEIRKRAGDKCEECGNKSDKHHVHHIVPRDQGGNHDFSNLILLCTRCHSKKKGKGHTLILPPRSPNTDSEVKRVETIKKTMGSWVRREAETKLVCWVCEESIDKKDTYKEFIVPVRRKDWIQEFRLVSPREAFKKPPIIIRRARKEHLCSVCHISIAKSDEYIEIKHVWEDAWEPPYGGNIPTQICLDCCSRKNVCLHCIKRYNLGRYKFELSPRKFKILYESLPVIDSN
jgi:5-methylcytosine-specific restriction endonuclease McrA